MKLIRGGEIQVEETPFKHISEQTMNHMTKVDKAWWRAIDKDDFNIIYKALEGDIKHWSNRFANRYRNSYYIDINDLISNCNLLLYRLWMLELTMDESITFYTNFKVKVQNGVFLQYLRTLKTNKNKMLCDAINGAKRVDQLEQEYGMELEDRKATQAINNVLNRMHVEAIYSLFNTGFFTVHEEAILSVMRANPDVSIRGLARVLDLHPETMSRILRKLRKK